MYLRRLFVWFLVSFAWLGSVLAEDAIATVQSPKEIIIAALLSALATAVVGILGYLGRLLGKFLNKKISDLDNDLLQKAAYVAVRFVDDAYKDLAGSEKFKLACSRLAQKLPGVNKDQIEEAVRAMYVNFSAEIPKNG